MHTWWPYFGNLYVAFDHHPLCVGVSLVTASIIAGMIVGMERESKNKPAGLRTVTLISIGSTIFTLASIYAGSRHQGDPTRIAAQVVTGMGFLGAGAIIRERGRIVGLTTAAIIWAVAALGVLIGVGYAVAGVALAVVIVGMLTLTKQIERRFLEPCSLQHGRILFHSANGKTRARIRYLLELYEVPSESWSFGCEGTTEFLDVHYCVKHPQHHRFIAHIATLKQVREIRDNIATDCKV